MTLIAKKKGLQYLVNHRKRYRVPGTTF